MDSFIAKHRDKIVGTLSCFDRLIFRGHLPINHTRGLQSLFDQRGILFKDLKSFMTRQADRLKAHAEGMAKEAGRPFRYLSGPARKEALARAIAESDGIEDGLVCVFSTLEPCRTFRLAYGDGRPRLLSANRKCLALYYYVIDRQFGLMHVRLQTWFPFTIQVYINGHEYLARKMDQNGLRYQQLENAFLWLEDPKRAQRFADGLPKKNWPRILSKFAKRVNPLLRDLLDGFDYYWVTSQSELATDIMFRDRAALKELYPRLLRHASLCFSAEDVLAFLGRKLHGCLEAEVLNDCKRRAQGHRVKHWMRANCIKMYDKQGRVLRVETVINKPDEFKIRRRVRQQGSWVTAWRPMRKGVANIHRYVEVSLAANRRYLEALSEIEDPSVAVGQLHELTRPVRVRHRRARALNPLANDDLDLFRSVLRGEHTISGFRNKDIRRAVFAGVRDPDQHRRQSAKVTRMLQRLHLHRLIAKVPRSRRWRVTDRGRLLMSAVLLIHDEQLPDLITQRAA